MDDDFKELPGGNVMAIRYKYRFIIWQFGDYFLEYVKAKKVTGRCFDFKRKH